MDLEELQRLKDRLGAGSYEASAPPPAAVRTPAPPSVAPQHHPQSVAPAAAVAASPKQAEEIQSLRAELKELRQELEALSETMRQQEKSISDLRSSLGG